jgi:predicted nucleotidyltransferase
MTMSSMFLFGSRAREDHDGGSDTDLLIACEERQPRHVSIGKVSMFFYPWPKLLADAASGELFAGHIALEGKPIQDPLDQLGELRGRRTANPSQIESRQSGAEVRAKIKVRRARWEAAPDQRRR